MSRPCPICKHKDATLKRLVEKDGIGYRIVACNECDFVFVQNPSMVTYVDKQSTPRAVPVRARHRHIKDLCDDLLDKRGNGRLRRVVEVGSGWGALARTFSDDKRYAYIGFEPSEDRARYCIAAGLPVKGEFFAPTALSAQVDAVILDNVLEHVSEPDELLQIATRVLAHRGILIVIVPNLHDVRQLLPQWRDRHHWQPRYHINYFTAQHLGSLLAQVGLEMRFFSPRLPRTTADLPVMIRATADRVGIHLLGLNCYAVKS